MIFLLALALHVVGEILVGDEQHVLGVDRLDHFKCVGRRAAGVRLGLNVGRAVDVGDDLEVGINFAQLGLALGQRLGRDALRQRASGPQVRQQHHPLGIEDLGGLGHEMDAAKHDNSGLAHLARLVCEFQRVADKVGDLEYFGALVVVRKHHGAALGLEPVDFVDLGGVALAGREVIAVLSQGGELAM